VKKGSKKRIRPPQEQDRQPGRESEMNPKPKPEPLHSGSGRLRDKVAIITGGDSGIGRAVSIAFAREGARVVVSYLNEHKDARETEKLVKQEGGDILLVAGDVGREELCRALVEKTIRKFGRLDIVVNNAAEQHPQESLEQIREDQLEKTFRTNIFSYFFLAKAALKHLREGSSIINTTSVTAYRGSAHLLDYSATKGAIVSFTRSLALSLASRKIRVNGVAPGPVWTPLIPSTFEAEKVAEFGSDVPLKRAGEPFEIAPSFVFLASEDSSYITGQVIHPNGGEIING
jgi:NAD(P)-dependent dehydrogenase (short-subunit alcohol dehydrogenase family)